MNKAFPSDREHEPWIEAMKYVTETCGQPPSLFAKTLCETIPIEPQKTRLLDVGCGSGIIGIYCLVNRDAAFVTFNDIQEEMISATRVNVAQQIRLGAISEAQVDYLRADFRSIPASVIGRHDLIAFNPPQLPETSFSTETIEKIAADSTLSYFRLGGIDGLAVARTFFNWYSRLLSPKPSVVILLSSFLGLPRIQEMFEREGLEWRILKRTRVPLRDILTDSAERLPLQEIADRLLMRTGSRKWTKELLTIAARPHS